MIATDAVDPLAPWTDAQRPQPANRGHIEDAVNALAAITANSRKALEERLEAIDERLDTIDGRFNGMDGRFDKIEEKIDTVFEAVKSVATNNRQLQDRVAALETRSSL